MQKMHDIFERVAVRALRSGIKLTSGPLPAEPVDKIRTYLGLDSQYFNEHLRFVDRIRYSLGVNDFKRPARVSGYESNPGRIIKRKLKSQFGEHQDYEEIYHVSQAIITMDFKHLTSRHSFALMIQSEIKNINENLPSVFGLVGVYDEDKQLKIRRLAIPDFQSEEIGALKDIPVNTTNVRKAMTYARLCARQVYAQTPLTPRYNWQLAETMVSDLEQANQQKPLPRP